MMKIQDKYLIGFDRFIDLNWVNQAYFIAKHDIELSEKKHQIKTYLANYIRGKDSIRKTANVLSRIWFKHYPELEDLKHSAFEIEISNEKELILFHWGLSINIFPFFKEVMNQIGNLLFIQDFFYSSDIETRMLNKYSNISSIPRATQRIIQTLEAWNQIIKHSSKKYVVGETISIENPKIIAWMLKAILLSAPSNRVLLSEVINQNFLFPFRANLNINREIYLNSEMTIERDGMNNDYLILKDNY